MTTQATSTVGDAGDPVPRARGSLSGVQPVPSARRRGTHRAPDVRQGLTIGKGIGAYRNAAFACAARTGTDQEGSTLIGLLLTLIVLAILVTVVALSLGTTAKNPPGPGTTKSASVAGTTKSASVAACNQTVETVEAAIDAYRAQSPTGDYPATLAALTTTTTGTPANPNGPWLRQVPSAHVAKNGYAITYTATGTLTVKTKTTTLPATTAKACKTA